jgi:hypothetical protein
MEAMMIALWISLGMLTGPIVLILALWFLRDVTPPILFVPSDWD